MLIDCDTCTARGTGCADCVVTVLLGAPPGWSGTDPVVVPMPARAEPAVPPGAVPPGAVPPGAVPPGAVPPGAVPPGAVPPGAVPPGAVPAGVVVEFDEVERRAFRALAEGGLVPPLRHHGAGGEDAGAAV